MFFNTANFKLLESAVDATWMKQQVHTQNLTNMNTPDYKAKQLTFEQVLKDVNSDGTDENILEYVMSNNPDLTVLQDGNNVDFEYENLQLYEAYVQHSLYLDKITGQFDNIKLVLNSEMR